MGKAHDEWANSKQQAGWLALKQWEHQQRQQAMASSPQYTEGVGYKRGQSDLGGQEGLLLRNRDRRFMQPQKPMAIPQRSEVPNFPRKIGLLDDASQYWGQHGLVDGLTPRGLMGSQPEPSPSGDRFDTDVIPHTLRMEGGLRDAGGELANFGIDQAYNQNVDVRNLTKDDATKIYKDKYWERPKIDEIENTTVASKVFDMGVNLGPGSSIKMLQRTLREMGQDIKVDGKIGKQTKLAIKAVEDMGGVDGLLTKLSDNQIEHYHNQLIKNPEKRTADFAGLINRGRYLRPEETNAPTEQELKLGSPSGWMTDEGNGRRAYNNNFGGYSTEYSIGVKHPGINNGELTHIPSIYDGRIVDQSEAENIILQNKGFDPETGRFITPGGDPEARSKNIKLIKEVAYKPDKAYRQSQQPQYGNAGGGYTDAEMAGLVARSQAKGLLNSR